MADPSIPPTDISHFDRVPDEVVGSYLLRVSEGILTAKDLLSLSLTSKRFLSWCELEARRRAKVLGERLSKKLASAKKSAKGRRTNKELPTTLLEGLLDWKRPEKPDGVTWLRYYGTLETEGARMAASVARDSELFRRLAPVVLSGEDPMTGEAFLSDVTPEDAAFVAQVLSTAEVDMYDGLNVRLSFLPRGNAPGERLYFGIAGYRKAPPPEMRSHYDEEYGMRVFCTNLGKACNGVLFTYHGLLEGDYSSYAERALSVLVKSGWIPNISLAAFEAFLRATASILTAMEEGGDIAWSQEAARALAGKKPPAMLAQRMNSGYMSLHCFALQIAMHVGRGESRHGLKYDY